jgi:hypothetical protein
MEIDNMLTKDLLPQDHNQVQLQEDENPSSSSTDPVSIPPPLKFHPTRARRQFAARLAQRQRRNQQQHDNIEAETTTTETTSDIFADPEQPSDHPNNDSNNVGSRTEHFSSDDTINDSLDSIDSFDGSGAGAAGLEKEEEEDMGIVLQKRKNQAPGVRFLNLGGVVEREDLEALGVGVGLGLEEDLQVEQHSSDDEGVIREEEEESNGDS